MLQLFVAQQRFCSRSKGDSKEATKKTYISMKTSWPNVSDLAQCHSEFLFRGLNHLDVTKKKQPVSLHHIIIPTIPIVPSISLPPALEWSRSGRPCQSERCQKESFVSWRRPPAVAAKIRSHCDVSRWWVTIYPWDFEGMKQQMSRCVWSEFCWTRCCTQQLLFVESKPSPAVQHKSSQSEAYQNLKNIYNYVVRMFKRHVSILKKSQSTISVPWNCCLQASHCRVKQIDY